MYAERKIKELAAQNLLELIEIRHHLHANPELSYKEFELQNLFKKNYRF